MAKRNINNINSLSVRTIDNVNSLDFSARDSIAFDGYGNIIMNDEAQLWSVGKDTGAGTLLSVWKNSRGTEGEINRVGVNIRYPQYAFHVVGDIFCTGKIITGEGVQTTASTQSVDSQQISGGGVFRNLDFAHSLASARGRRAA